MRFESTSALNNKINVLAIMLYSSNKFYQYTSSGFSEYLFPCCTLLKKLTILSQEINLMSSFFVK